MTIHKTSPSYLSTVANVERITVRVPPDGRLTRRDAAAYLGRADKTLAMWATEGKGPQPRKVGGRIFYFLDDLDAFIGRKTESRGDERAETPRTVGVDGRRRQRTDSDGLLADTTKVQAQP